MMMKDDNEDTDNDASAVQLAAQQEEMESMAAIFADDFTLLSQDPTSYSIRLCMTDQFTGASYVEDQKLALDAYLLRPPDDLALTVAYPPTYPDTNIPIFGISYDKTKVRLHDVQEQAIFKIVTTVAHAELGMPSVYSCICATKEFLEGGGLSQAGLSLLSDDCLANILSYLATSKDEIDEICLALPIFSENAAKTNILWKQLCKLRWKEKWGFEKRWARALENFEAQSDQHFWMHTYNNEEDDSKRNVLTREELCAMTYDLRSWFSLSSFRPLHSDEIRIPTGLKQSKATDIAMSDAGKVQSNQNRTLRYVVWEPTSNDKAITQVRWSLTMPGAHKREYETLTVSRLDSWGWELRGKSMILRAIDSESVDADSLWDDLISNMIVQYKPEWVLDHHRAPFPYNCREIPDDEDCKMLEW